MTVEEAQERTNQSMSFAVQHFYSPELDWKVGGFGFGRLGVSGGFLRRLEVVI